MYICVILPLGLVATAAALESTNTYIKAYVKTMDGLI